MRGKRKAEKAFERALLHASPEEKAAASVIAANIFNGASWAFCEKQPVFDQLQEEFQNSETCRLYAFTANWETGETGYLVWMQMERFLELLSEENGGLLTQQDMDLCREQREKSLLDLVERIGSGYAGKIGIFATGDSPVITVGGKCFPACHITLRELCTICAKCSYGIVVSGRCVDPRQVLRREENVLKCLAPAPLGNALLIEIGPMNL